MSSASHTVVVGRMLFVVLPLLLMLGLVPAVARAQVAPIDLLLEGRGDDYWVCFVTNDPLAKSTISSVRQRVDPVKGTWVEIARLQTRLTDIAAVGDRLAALTQDGEIRLLWPGGGTLAPSLPGNRQAMRLASSADGLWALGAPAPVKSATTKQASTKPSTTAPATTKALAAAPASQGDLLKWNGSTWTVVSALPPDASAAASLAIYNGDPHIAYITREWTMIDRLRNGTWERVRQLPQATYAKLIGSTPKPLLVWDQGDNPRSIVDLTTNPPTPLQTISVKPPSDVASVTSNLRVVYADGTKLMQQGFYDNGQGAAFGPEVVAQVLGPVDAQRQQWMQILVMTLMTVAMILTLRSRPAIPEELLDKAGLRLAPLGRRLTAGLIDAIPLLVPLLYVSDRLSDATGPFEHVTDGMIPGTIGLAIYLLHVTLSEMIFGRSIGKKMLGLTVILNDGSPLTASQAFLRNIMRVLDFSLMFLPLVFLIISPMRQRIGDLAAGTLVVVKRADDAKPSEKDLKA